MKRDLFEFTQSEFLVEVLHYITLRSFFMDYVSVLFFKLLTKKIILFSSTHI